MSRAFRETVNFAEDAGAEIFEMNHKVTKEFKKHEELVLSDSTHMKCVVDLNLVKDILKHVKKSKEEKIKIMGAIIDTLFTTKGVSPHACFLRTRIIRSSMSFEEFMRVRDLAKSMLQSTLQKLPAN